jgi:hypothetical protein
MTLQTSGPISMEQINAEFGLGGNLNAYRGNIWFTDTYGEQGSFGTPISFSDFYGKRATNPLGGGGGGYEYN